MRYTDPTGHLGDPDRDRTNKDGTIHTDQLLNPYHLASHPKYEDTWLEETGFDVGLYTSYLGLRYHGVAINKHDMQAYRDVSDHLGCLQTQIGRHGLLGPGLTAAHLGEGSSGFTSGPDGTLYAKNNGMLPEDVNGMTIGDMILVSPDMWDQMTKRSDTLMIFAVHEYVHVLQFRQAPIGSSVTHSFYSFKAEILHDRGMFWRQNPLEIQAFAIEQIYESHPSLPPLWDLW